MMQDFNIPGKHIGTTFNIWLLACFKMDSSSLKSARPHSKDSWADPYILFSQGPAQGPALGDDIKVQSQHRTISESQDRSAAFVSSSPSSSAFDQEKDCAKCQNHSPHCSWQWRPEIVSCTLSLFCVLGKLGNIFRYLPSQNFQN